MPLDTEPAIAWVFVTSVSASSNSRSTTSACDFVRTSGGAKRTALRPAPRIRTPRRNIACTTRVAFLDGAFLGLLIADQLDANHQPSAANVADDRVLLLQVAEAVHEVLADGRGVLHVLLLQKADRDQRRGACHRVAAERAGVRARRPAHDVLAGARDPERKTGGDALGDVDDVAGDVEVLGGEHLARPPHAGLHFVQHQHDAVLLC